MAETYDIKIYMDMKNIFQTFPSVDFHEWNVLPLIL